MMDNIGDEEFDDNNHNNFIEQSETGLYYEEGEEST